MSLSDSEVKSKTELLKAKLEKLDVLLDYKNRNYCKKYLKKILKEFF